MKKFSASHENNNINNDRIYALYSTFNIFNNYFSEKELLEIYDYITRYFYNNYFFLIRLVESEFSSIKEVCNFMENYILKTKYNLKRIQSSKKNIVTFCCSCCNNIKKESNNLYLDEEDIIFASLNSFDEKYYFKFTKKKRANIQSCYYRIKFLFIEDLHCFTFISKKKEIKKLIHNHKPFFSENQNIKVSFIFPFLNFKIL